MSARRHEYDPETGWFGALRWFSAEFLVVVTGVLVALALNAWWQERDHRDREIAYLQQLAADLDATERSIQSVRDFHLERAVAAARVRRAYWMPEPPTLEELLDDLGRPFSSRRVRPILGTIEALIATGELRLIRDDALRTELTAFADFTRATIDNIHRHDETYFRPAVNALVEHLDVGELVHLRAIRDEAPAAALSGPLSPLPDEPRRAPFPTDIETLLSNRALYAAYHQLLTAHRNQSFGYLMILERTRRLRGEVHRQLHSTLDPGNCQLRAVDRQFVGQCGSLPNGQPITMIELSLDDPLDANRWIWQLVPDARRLLAGRWTLGEEQAAAITLEADIFGHGQIHAGDMQFTISGLAMDEAGVHLSFRVAARDR